MSSPYFNEANHSFYHISDETASVQKNNFQLVITDGKPSNALARFFIASADALENLRPSCLFCNIPRYATEDSAPANYTSSSFLWCLSSDVDEKPSSQPPEMEDVTCTDFYKEQFIKNRKLSDSDMVAKNSRRVLYEQKQNILLSCESCSWEKFTSDSADVVSAASPYAAILEEITGTSRLVWHPSGEPKGSGYFKDCPEDKSALTVEVTLGFERGILSTESLMASPKLVLNFVHKEKLQMKHRGSYYIELWEIIQILELENLPSKMCSFAKRHCSFAVVTIRNFFLFEATDKEERNRLVILLNAIMSKFAQDPTNDVQFVKAPIMDSHSQKIGRRRCTSGDENIMSIQRSFAVDEYD